MSLLEHIFPLQSQWLVIDENKEECNKRSLRLNHLLTDLRSNACDNVVIAGPDRMDKTSLAFQAAVTAAALSSKVVYICTHPISRLPVPIHGMNCPEPDIMRNVDFLYLEDCKELLSWLASIHIKKKWPDFIVVEDILTYSSQINENNLEMGLAKLCALFSDSSSWISKHNETKNCSVLWTAPSRMASLEFVLSQFGFRLAHYTGPSVDDSVSHLVYQWKSGKINVAFQKINNCLMVKDIYATHIT